MSHTITYLRTLSSSCHRYTLLSLLYLIYLIVYWFFANCINHHLETIKFPDTVFISNEFFHLSFWKKFRWMMVGDCEVEGGENNDKLCPSFHIFKKKNSKFLSPPPSQNVWFTTGIFFTCPN